MLGFKGNNSGAESDAIVREIAERCASTTLLQLSAAAELMNASQLRGYVRAYAWPLVWAEAKSTQDRFRLSKHYTDDMAARALEQTVHLVTGAYLTPPVVVMPAPHIGRRAA